MIGKNKKGKLILCSKCGSKNLEQGDWAVDIDEGIVVVDYDVMCLDCDHCFEIKDRFKYCGSTSNEIDFGE